MLPMYLLRRTGAEGTTVTEGQSLKGSAPALLLVLYQSVFLYRPSCAESVLPLTVAYISGDKT